MGASFLCGHCGIENAVVANSAAYIAGWLKKLRDDKRLVIHAAAAQKAADFILGPRNSDDETDTGGDERTRTNQPKFETPPPRRSSI
jgi:antirestriction protein ArdC